MRFFFYMLTFSQGSHWWVCTKFCTTMLCIVQELVGSEGFEPWPNQTRSYSFDYRLYYIIVKTVDVLKIFSVEKPDIVIPHSGACSFSSNKGASFELAIVR